MLYRLAQGVRVEALADTWAAFGGLSGDTLQLNAEAAAVLELLAEGPMDELNVCRVLASDAQTDVAEVAHALSHVWGDLLMAGLLRADASPANNPG